jgi:hypothetical protein
MKLSLASLPRPLAIKPRFWISRRSVRLVGALLTVKIRLAVPPAACRRRIARAVPRVFARGQALRPKALHRRPGLDQRAVDREMVRAEQTLHPRAPHYRAQELGGEVALQKTLAVLGERRVIPRRIVDADADEPAKQEVKLQPLHQLTLRADRIESLQQHRPKELLRRDRGTAAPRIKRRELA